MNTLRQTRIKEYIEHKSVASIKELHALFPEVSLMTIHRDLDALEAGGFVVKFRGGAKSVRLTDDPEFHVRVRENNEGKQIIAQKALGLIQPHTSIFLDAGTTNLLLAKSLPDINLNVITTGPSIALELAKLHNPVVTLCCGTLNRKNLALSGQNTLNMLESINIDLALIGVSGYYQPIMNDAGMTTQEITQALVAYPVVFGVLTMSSGFLADRFGRKKTITGFSLAALVMYVAFLLGAYNGLPPILVGVCYALYIGSYWIGKDYIEIMMTENTPTDIRASVIAGANIVFLAGTAVGYLVVLIGIQFLPIWLPCLITVVPGLLVSTFLVMTRVKETRGVDYAAIEDGE
jgi:DeoR/GlpR family transcriptional regulator of sugar metabolism